MNDVKNNSFEVDQHSEVTIFFEKNDDVIGNVRASGGLGDVADDCVRGAVDV